MMAVVLLFAFLFLGLAALSVHRARRSAVERDPFSIYMPLVDGPGDG
jgi:hypothetical protein